MGFRIRRNADSIISAQAVAGGDLLADTLYYVCCIWGQTSAWRDGDAHSDFTNEVSVLTTTVNKSIQINYEWTVNIEAFSDAGGGKVWVKTDELHCLVANDNITISGTTNYDGDYVVTYVEYVDDYDMLQITHSWDGDDATGTIACDDDIIGANSYISTRVNVVPLYVGGEPDHTNCLQAGWIGPGYSAVNPSQGYTITSQPTATGLYAATYMPRWRKDGLPKGITRYDRPYFEVVNYEAYADWITHMETWLPTNTNYQEVTGVQADTLYFLGAIKMQSLTSLMTITAINFVNDGGFYAPAPTVVQDYLHWDKCFYRQLGVRRPKMGGTFIDSVIRNECQDGAYMDDILIQDCALYPRSSYTFYGTGSAQIDGATIQLPSKSNHFWYVYPDAEIPQTRVKNLELREGYFYIYSPYENAIIADDTHYMEDINIYSQNVNIDIYLYQPSGDRQIEVLNVRAPLQTNGICRVARHVTYPENNDVYFYFSVTMKIVDEAGDPIVGATVTLTDKDSNIVTDDTDGSGDVSFNVKSYQNLAWATDVYGTYTDFNPFVLTVEKDGYQDYTESNMDFYDKIDKTIALQPPAGSGTNIYGSTIYGSTIQ